MRKILLLLLFIPLLSFSQEAKEIDKQDHLIVPKKIVIQDNVERMIIDYTQSEELGLFKMLAPVGWTEPIIEAQFEIRGIVLKGLLGLEYENSEEHIVSGNGFVIPKNTRVRIFNAGEEELILIEVLRPAYNKEFVQKFSSF
tara:strand:+ start:75 stop:500 length:426 start_codon:yes stop_codon:yes gene_type:complete